MIDQRGQKSDLSITIGASEPVTIVPLNQEALRPSCDMALPNVEKALKVIKNNLTDAETQTALVAVEKVLSKLSEDGQVAFASAVLPQMVERPSKSPTLSPLKMLEELAPLAENRALEFSLPLLLQALPEAGLTTFIGRLQAISVNCGSCQDVVLTQILPDYIRSAGDKFTSSMFYSFQELCRILKENTQKAFELLGPIFGSPPECNMDPRLPTFLLEVLGFSLTSESAYKGLTFCADLLKLIDSDQPSANRKIFDSGIKAWSDWGASKQAGVAEQFLALMKHIDIKFSTAAAKDALSCLNNPDTAQAIIVGSFALPKRLSAEQVLSHLKKVNRVIEIFPTEFHQAVAEYFSISVVKEQERVCEKLLYGLLSKSYNARRIGPHLAFLSQALKRFSQQDFDVLSEELVNLPGVLSELIERKDAVDYTPLNYILLRIVTGENGRFNHYNIDEEAFFSRWKSRKGFYLKPVFSLNQVMINISIASSDSSVSVKSGVSLDEDFISDKLTEFNRVSRINESDIILSIADIVKCRGGPNLQFGHLLDVFPLLTAASRCCPPEEFKSVIRSSFPILAPAAATELAKVADYQKPSLEEKFDFLESLRLLMDDAIVIILDSYGMERPAIEKIKRTASISKINRELAKFEKAVTSEKATVYFETAKNALDEFYGPIAETCIDKIGGNDLEKPFFQPIRGVIYPDNKIVGCWYSVVGDVLGERSVILAGGGPRRSFLKRIDTKAFYRDMIAAFKPALKKEGFNGLYQAVGGPLGDKAWSSEGRIGQFPEVEAALVPANPLIIELPPSKQIDFPSGYNKYGRLRRVFRLS